MIPVSQTPTTVFHCKGQTYPYAGVMSYDLLKQFLDSTAFAEIVRPHSPGTFENDAIQSSSPSAARSSGSAESCWRRSSSMPATPN